MQLIINNSEDPLCIIIISTMLVTVSIILTVQNLQPYNMLIFKSNVNHIQRSQCNVLSCKYLLISIRYILYVEMMGTSLVGYSR